MDDVDSEHGDLVSLDSDGFDEFYVWYGVLVDMGRTISFGPLPCLCFTCSYIGYFVPYKPLNQSSCTVCKSFYFLFCSSDCVAVLGSFGW